MAKTQEDLLRAFGGLAAGFENGTIGNYILFSFWYK